MKGLTNFLICVTLVAALSSCGHKQRIASLEAQLDTLMTDKAQQTAEMKDLQSYLDTIASTLDSIARLEGMLFMPDPENPGQVLTRKEIDKRLKAFHELIGRQREKIQRLEASLDASNANVKHLKSVIAYLNTQIEEKDAEIERMRGELKTSKATVTRLNEKVSMLESDVAALNESYDELQQEARQQQENFDAALSQVHYLVADKKQLTSMGLLKNGKIKTENLDLDLFTVVDSRTFTSLVIQDGRPKILTSMPASAYELKQASDGTSVLVINDTDTFWKASKVLIVQIR
jgi:chromosome segregation ATPase